MTTADESGAAPPAAEPPLPPATEEEDGAAANTGTSRGVDDEDEEEVPTLWDVDSDDDEEAPDLIVVGDEGPASPPVPAAAPPASDSEPTAAARDLPPVPVTILTGFLGSGKTTLVRRILSDPTHGFRVAVIENEFGGGDDSSAAGGAVPAEERERLGLSVESLIARDGATGGSLADLIELPNGCVCCTVKDSLVATLESLLDKRSDLDYVLIEASGMANPGPIASVFWLDEALGSRLRLDGVVCCVDARNLLRQLEETSGGRGGGEEGGEEAARQIAFADRILVNKIDLLPPQNSTAEEQPASGPGKQPTHTLQCILDAVRSINPAAPLRTTTYSDVGPDMVGWALKADCFDAGRAREVEELLESEATEAAASTAGVGECDGGASCAHDRDRGHDHDYDRARDRSRESPPKPAHSHTHSSVGTVALLRRGSVSLRSVHAWLASILWPDQDEEDRVLRARLEEPTKNGGSDLAERAALGSTVVGTMTTEKGVMSIFRVKGILSVRHPLDDHGKVMLEDDPDFDPENGSANASDNIHPVTGLDRRRYIVQAVNDLWEIHPAGDALRWSEAGDGRGNGDNDEEEEGRMCKLVVIGRNLDNGTLEGGFAECFVRRPDGAPGSSQRS